MTPAVLCSTAFDDAILICPPENFDRQELEEADTSSTQPKEYCIYKVPRDLREINEKAYTPQVVSIGPLHHHKDEYLIKMEEQKLTYVEKLIKRPGMDRLEEFRSYIKGHEQEIRDCYAENLDYFESDKFVEMILLDVVFIFELFLRNDERSATMKSERDILLDTLIRKATIKRDLQLLENQLPYFVLKELFSGLGYSPMPREGKHFSRLGDSAKPREREQFSDAFLILALRFLYDSDQDCPSYSTYDLQHFTDLKRCFLLKKFSPPNNNPDKHLRDLRCATKLHGSGVKFRKENRSSEIRSKCIKRPLQMIPCIKLQELVLEIPRFEVFDATECLFRNVMAFELLHYPRETHVCNFVLFMDFLIDTEKDVDLLVEKEIVFNCLGDNAAVANMFNKLCLQVTPSHSCYCDIGEKLKTHYHKRWNHAKATLKNVYFRDLWIGTGTVAAALLLLLTLVQTACSILQVL